MHPQKPGWGWEPKKTWWAGAEASLDLVGGTHSLHRVQSQVWTSSASWTPSSNDRQWALEGREIQGRLGGKEAPGSPPSVPRAGGGDFSPTRRRFRPGVLGTEGFVQVPLEGRRGYPAGGRPLLTSSICAPASPGASKFKSPR